MENIIDRKKHGVRFKALEVPPFPKEVFLDLTSLCNHACVFCANPRIKNKKTMNHEMAIRVINEAYECGTRELGMYATGDSFMVKNLHEYVEYAKNKVGYDYLFITTNGGLASPERVKPVLDAGLDSLKFSISAGKRETFKEIQGKDDFDKVISNLKWVSKYRQESGLKYRIYVTMVYTSKTECEVNILRDIVKPYIDEWDPHTLTNQCGNLYENNDLGNISSTNPRGRGDRNVCFQPFKSLTITPEGFVSACVVDYSKDLIVADLNKVSLKQAWEGEIYREFRKKHKARNLKGMICFNCMYNENEAVTPLMPEYAQHFK